MNISNKEGASTICIWQRWKSVPIDCFPSLLDCDGFINTVEFLRALLSFPGTVAYSFLFGDRAWADILELARYWNALRAPWRYLIETILSFCMTWIWPWLLPEQTTHVKLIGLAARSKSCGPTNQTIILNLYLEEWSLLPSKLIYLFHQIQIIPIAIFDNHDRVLRQHFQGGARQISKNYPFVHTFWTKSHFLILFDQWDRRSTLIDFKGYA